MITILYLYQNRILQSLLFDLKASGKFPTTRYQGSKLKYIDWIWNNIRDLEFETVLDAFGGTGSVAYKLKSEDKTVTYNDLLKFNHVIGSALIQNDNEIVSDEELDFIITKHGNHEYPNFIENTFQDIYYTDEENQWLDVAIHNINQLGNPKKKHLAYFALFQSCIIKRPFNLFHRKNLYIRQSQVERSFGNKASWDTPFAKHFKNFVKEVNAAVFSNGKVNTAINKNVLDITGTFDLVYLDPPYVSDKGVGTDYLDFYHFLEGIVEYENWPSLINYKSKHKRLNLCPNEWTNTNSIEASFESVIRKFRDSILVISYRSDGIPSISQLVSMLADYGKVVTIHESSDMKYVLSKKVSSEVLIVAQ